MRRQSAHVDAEVLAELSAGLIDGKRATRIHAHLAGCQRCAQRSASLAEISTLLTSVPSPRMPDDVVTRLNATLAREAAHRSAPATAPARSSNQDTANTVVEFSRAAKGRRRVLTSPVAARAFAAAAAACVVAAGGYTAVQLTTGGSSTPIGPGVANGPVTTKHAASRGGSARGLPTGSVHAQPFIPKTGNGASNGPEQQLAFKVVDSGIDYQSTSLRTQIKTELNKVVALKSLHTPTPQQYACVSDVTGGTAPALVDKARFQGRPATIIALSHVGKQFSQAWVVGPSCSASKTDILEYVTLPTSGG
ncbi:MAG TPA: hypothetical protein VH089_00520 [Streptosporangiaceae bacterium]|nr:hypothetical protein [Streptosporangiaceae bacterium]